MVIGAVVFIIAFLGCCGAIKESSCMVLTVNLNCTNIREIYGIWQKYTNESEIFFLLLFYFSSHFCLSWSLCLRLELEHSVTLNKTTWMTLWIKDSTKLSIIIRPMNRLGIWFKRRFVSLKFHTHFPLQNPKSIENCSFFIKLKTFSDEMLWNQQSWRLCSNSQWHWFAKIMLLELAQRKAMHQNWCIEKRL